MTVFQNLQPMTRAKLARLSLPDIRVYAKAYKVPADIVEQGTADELLELIFKFRPRHPKEYPINTPHLFTHRIARTQRERDEDFRNHKPYTGFAHFENLEIFRRSKGQIDPPQPQEDADRTEATEVENQLDDVEDELRYHPAHPSGSPVIGQPVASSSVAPTREPPNPLVERPRDELSPLHGSLEQELPSADDPAPCQPPAEDEVISSTPSTPSTTYTEFARKLGRSSGDSSFFFTREDWLEYGKGLKDHVPLQPPPAPPSLGFEVTDDLSNLKSALEEHQGAIAACPKPSPIIVDDELFGLEFTRDMSQAGREAIIHERYAIAMSNRKMIEQMLAEAEAEAKQVLWKLTALQPDLYARHNDMQGFFDGFCALSKRHDILVKVIPEGERLAKNAWEAEWLEDWIFTEDDEKEEEEMRVVAQARAAEVQSPTSSSVPIPHRPSKKRPRDEEEGELEYADEEEPRAGTPRHDTKRPRVESRETSTAPPSPSPRPKDKGKGRAPFAEDSFTLPFPSSSFHIPPPPRPQFRPEDRRNVYPVYKPAVPGYEPPHTPEAEGGNQPGQHDGGHPPDSDEGDDPNDGPRPTQAQKHNGNDGEDQIGGGQGGNGSGRNNGGQSQRITQMHRRQPARGAPHPADVQPGDLERVDLRQVLCLCYDRVERGDRTCDHTQMGSDLKRQINWSMLGSQHPESTRYREWDDELEEQNPWHQGGRPILKQQQ